MKESLADRIEERIRKIPVTSTSHMALYQETLSNVLSRPLIRQIAEEAAKEFDIPSS